MTGPSEAIVCVMVCAGRAE
jgi:hypothetical protein